MLLNFATLLVNYIEFKKKKLVNKQANLNMITKTDVLYSNVIGSHSSEYSKSAIFFENFKKNLRRIVSRKEPSLLWSGDSLNNWLMLKLMQPAQDKDVCSSAILFENTFEEILEIQKNFSSDLYSFYDLRNEFFSILLFSFSWKDCVSSSQFLCGKIATVSFRNSLFKASGRSLKSFRGILNSLSEYESAVRSYEDTTQTENKHGLLTSVSSSFENVFALVAANLKSTLQTTTSIVASVYLLKEVKNKLRCNDQKFFHSFVEVGQKFIPMAALVKGTSSARRRLSYSAIHRWLYGIVLQDLFSFDYSIGNNKVKQYVKGYEFFNLRSRYYGLASIGENQWELTEEKSAHISEMFSDMFSSKSIVIKTFLLAFAFFVFRIFIAEEPMDEAAINITSATLNTMGELITNFSNIITLSAIVFDILIILCFMDRNSHYGFSMACMLVGLCASAQIYKERKNFPVSKRLKKLFKLITPFGKTTSSLDSYSSLEHLYKIFISDVTKKTRNINDNILHHLNSRNRVNREDGEVENTFKNQQNIQLLLSKRNRSLMRMARAVLNIYEVNSKVPETTGHFQKQVLNSPVIGDYIIFPVKNTMKVMLSGLDNRRVNIQLLLKNDVATERKDTKKSKDSYYVVYTVSSVLIGAIVCLDNQENRAFLINNLLINCMQKLSENDKFIYIQDQNNVFIKRSVNEFEKNFISERIYRLLGKVQTFVASGSKSIGLLAEEIDKQVYTTLKENPSYDDAVNMLVHETMKFYH